MEDVADRIADLLASPAAGETSELGGPGILSIDELARTWPDAHSRRPIWRLRLPGGMSRAIRAGGQTTAATPVGVGAWRDYLAGKY